MIKAFLGERNLRSEISSTLTSKCLWGCILLVIMMEMIDVGTGQPAQIFTSIRRGVPSSSPDQPELSWWYPKHGRSRTDTRMEDGFKM